MHDRLTGLTCYFGALEVLLLNSNVKSVCRSNEGCVRANQRAPSQITD